MKAYEIIADPERWVQHTYATNALGMPVLPHEPNACRWCAHGALLKTYPGCSGKLAFEYEKTYGKTITTDNDRPSMTAAEMSERLRVVEE